MILSGVFNWDWWYESRKVKIISKLLTRKGARVFYMAVGAIIVFYGMTEL